MPSPTRRICFTAVLSILLLLALAMPMSSARATDVCVDPDGSTCPYTTIQAAITAASGGDTINVHAGTYVEELTIDKSLTLLGPNAAINPNTGVRVAEAIILPSVVGLDIAGTCTKLISLTGVLTDVTIKGFTLDGHNAALSSGVYVNGVEVAACQGIAGRNNLTNIVIENNIIKNIIHSGVYLRNLDTPGATAGNYVRYNQIDNLGNVGKPYGYGVIVQNNFYADITDNVITAARTGIQTNTYNLANPGTTGSISNNAINAWRSGIFHYHWYSAASSISVDHNTITPMAHDQEISGLGWWNGIVLADFGTTGSTTVVDNVITVPADLTFIETSYSAGYNVVSDSPTIPLTISGGTVTRADYGVFVNNYEGYPDILSDPTSIVIDGVSILNSAIAGVYVKDSPSNTNGATVFANIQNSLIDSAGTGILLEGTDATAQANYNRVSGNPTAGVTNPNTTVMDAQNNWWGSPSGPSGSGIGSGDSVSAHVDFIPWCIDVNCAASTPFATTTSITSDLPDPSSRGNLVTIHFSVSNNTTGGLVPAGTVDISDGATEICSNIALDGSGLGSCTYSFAVAGTHTLSAVFTPANTDYFTGSTGTADHRVVNKPILLSPANTAQLLYNRPTFDWTSVTDAALYRIQIATEPTFTDRLVNVVTSASSYKPATSLPANVTLYWRARIETPSISKWSKVFSFTTANPPSVPVLLLPANGASITDLTPLLDWKNSTVPVGTTFDHYQLQVFTVKSSPGTSLVLLQNKLGSQFTFSTDLTGGTTYFWRVRSYNTDGEYSDWSKAWSFTVQP